MDSTQENEVVLKHRSGQNVAVTIEGIRYAADKGFITVTTKVGDVILKDYPDWGKANPKVKKVKKEEKDG